MLLITVFLEIGDVAMDLIPILLILGSLPLAHNAQHSLCKKDRSNNVHCMRIINYTIDLIPYGRY